MFKRLISSALVFGLAATAPPAAMAQANCGVRETVIERLATVYKESLSGGGLQSPKSLIEVWSSEESGSWTIMSTRPDGLSCILAHGLFWHDQDQVPNALGTKARFD